MIFGCLIKKKSVPTFFDLKQVNLLIRGSIQVGVIYIDRLVTMAEESTELRMNHMGELWSS